MSKCLRALVNKQFVSPLLGEPLPFSTAFFVTRLQSKNPFESILWQCFAEEVGNDIELMKYLSVLGSEFEET